MKPTREQLNAYLDGELEAAERQQMEDYLRANPEVMATLEAWRRDGAALKDALEAVPLPANPALTPRPFAIAAQRACGTVSASPPA